MMLTPCWPSAGPTGGAGVAAPAWICSLMTAASFFLGGMSGPQCPCVVAVCRRYVRPAGRAYVLDLLHLVERELDRRLTSEDRHQDLELLRVGVDLVDRRRQRGERAVHDRDGLADLEVGGPGLDDLLLLLLLRREELQDLVEGQRGGPVGVADEARHAGGVADRAPGLVGEVHADQDVAGEEVLLDLLALAVLDDGLLALRDLHLEDEVLHVQRGRASLEVGLDP